MLAAALPAAPPAASEGDVLSNVRCAAAPSTALLWQPRASAALHRTSSMALASSMLTATLGGILRRRRRCGAAAASSTLANGTGGEGQASSPQVFAGSARISACRRRRRVSSRAVAGSRLADGSGEEGRSSSPPVVARASFKVWRSGLRMPFWSWPLRGKREKREQGGVLTADEVAGESDLVANPEEELALLTQDKPMRVAMLGSRDCPFQHQQEIELLSEARVSRGDHVYTSGSSGTNSSVIKGALRAGRPRLLTVVLPQSFGKQDEESQALLRKCLQAGVQVQPTPANDRLTLPEAARACNTRVLGRVQKLIAFAARESLVYLELVDEAKQSGIVTTRFFLD